MNEVFNLDSLATQPDAELHRRGKIGICIAAGWLVGYGLLCYFFRDKS